jgi:hypothetical protein
MQDSLYVCEQVTRASSGRRLARHLCLPTLANVPWHSYISPALLCVAIRIFSVLARLWMLPVWITGTAAGVRTTPREHLFDTRR